MLHRKVIITGATRGIGREIALVLAKAGCSLILVGRDQERLDQIVADAKIEGATEVFPVRCDISNPAEVSQIRETAEKGKKWPLVLVNNAGIAIFAKFIDLSTQEIQEHIQTNLLGTMYVSQAILPLMLKKAEGQILNIASNAAIHAFQGSSAYGTSKAGVLAFSKILSEEVRRHGVRVTAILPGAVNTEIWNKTLFEKEEVSAEHPSSKNLTDHLEAKTLPKQQMLSVRAIAEVIRDLITMPSDRFIDQIEVTPQTGIIPLQF